MEVEDTADGELITVSQHGHTAVITLNDPARRNVLSLALRRQLLRRLGELRQRDDLRAIILTGGDGCFCSGGDLRSLGELDVTAARARLRNGHQLLQELVGGNVPVIAAVEGPAYGAGLSIAALCDIVVSAEDARWCCSFGRVGLMPDFGALWSLPRRIGPGRTRLLIYTARVLTGREAVEWGLADIVCPPGAALSVAEGIAAEIVRTGPEAIAMSRAVLAGQDLGLKRVLEEEANAQALLLNTPGFVEGRAAFLEKRDPDFNRSSPPAVKAG